MKLVETTEYDLINCHASPKFELIIKKEEIKASFLIYLGITIGAEGINLLVEENDEFITLKINGNVSICGNFTETIEKIKAKIVRTISEKSTRYDLNLEIELMKTKTMEDVLNAKKEYALKREDKEEYCINGNPEDFLTKNTNLSSLSIKIGRLFYIDNQYKDGFLGKTLKAFAEKYNLKCKYKQRTYFDVTNEELLDLIDLLEPK